MLARGIRSYHRPTRLDEALDLMGRGVVPLAGGTRLLATPRELPNVLDLYGLDLRGIEVEDGDLILGALTTLQDVLDSPLAATETAGLLPAAARAQSASRAIRSMATIGGESVHGAHDSEVVAALLALNAVYAIAHRQDPRETPALRFLRNPAEDLEGGGLVRTVAVAGAPGGAALERLAAPGSDRPIVAVAVTATFAGENCTRARIALTGLVTRPARVLEAEGQIERGPAEEDAIGRAVDQLHRAPFRSDAQASASFRLEVARVLTRRALRTAIAAARPQTVPPEPARVKRTAAPRPAAALPYFTSGRMEVTVNGRPLRAEVEARTTLLDLLRQGGLIGAKDGCGVGDCGTCAVILDGRPVNACLTLALRAQGRTVQTAEGLGTRGLHRLQSAFMESGAVLCGYCTPALLVHAKALLDAVPEPSRGDVESAFAGVGCPCTGGVRPTEAVLQAVRNRG
jgi:CO/xanthine dehydrogenase FAD-binding subunit/aerobic-type carbon monoxide dehydrogenase small subunit (CoxS/CutS family)